MQRKALRYRSLLSCSNLGSATRLEKRLNEIVAIPVYRKPLGFNSTNAHSQRGNPAETCVTNNPASLPSYERKC